MKLTKDCKKMLNIIREIEPEQQGRFFKIETMLQKSGHDLVAFWSIVNHLIDEGCIEYADKQHSLIRLKEPGRKYEEFRWISFRDYVGDKWIDFFACLFALLAVVISVIALIQSMPQDRNNATIETAQAAIETNNLTFGASG